MGAIKIIIIKGDPATGLLDLGDKFNANAKNKDVVTWHLKNNKTVLSIEHILVKPPPADPSDDIWSIEPHPVAGSTDWKGILLDAIPADAVWNYYIQWQDLNGKTHICDPKIIVNSTRE